MASSCEISIGFDSQVIFIKNCFIKEKMATEIYSQFKIKIFLLIFTTSWVVFTDAECDYYLAPSKNPHMGRAVIAGRDFEPDSIATTAPGLVVPSESIEDTQLENYVFAVYDFESENFVSGYSKILFGTQSQSKL